MIHQIIYNSFKFVMENWLPLQFLYIQTRTEDVQPIKYEKLVEFVIDHHVKHVAIGLIDPQSTQGKIICAVDRHAIMIKHFFMKLPKGVRVSAHPYDGFADPKQPFRYISQNKQNTKLKAVLKYVRDLNQLLKAEESKVLISGLVFGEGLGGLTSDKNQEKEHYKATVKDLRRDMKKYGLKQLKIGASPGGPNRDLDESYFQCYDWTFNDKTNPNLWDIHKNNPDAFFNAVIQGHGGWNTDGKQKHAPWCETREYYKDNLKKWQWEIPNANVQKKHYMWALNVPDKEKGKNIKRLSAWNRNNGIKEFYTYVQNQMNKGKTDFLAALYVDQGLKYFV